MPTIAIIIILILLLGGGGGGYWGYSNHGLGGLGSVLGLVLVVCLVLWAAGRM